LTPTEENALIKFIVALMWAMLGVPLSFIATGSNFYLCLLAALAPIALTLWSKRRGDAIANKRFDELLRLAGMPRTDGLNHLEMGTGIAIDRGQRKILLVAGKAAKAYSFDDIRSWEGRKGRGGGRAVGYGMQGALAAGASNLSDARQADQETGFHLKMRDMERAEWRISMFIDADRARWTEILQQAVNESRTEARNAHA
jgi:hypothetical protein